MVEQIIADLGVPIKMALSRTPLPEYEYHSVGFDIFIELIQFAFDNPFFVEQATTDSYIDHLNSLLCLEEVMIVHDLEELYWSKLVKKIEDNPAQGVDFIYKINLWRTICTRAYNSKIRLNNRIAYSFSYIILHAACNQKRYNMPAEICELIRVLLLIFLRSSEDTSLPKKQR